MQPALGTLLLCNRDRTVQRDNRRRPKLYQGVIERDDRFPVGVFRIWRAGVNRRDRGLDVILGEFRAPGRKIQELKSCVDERLIPALSILIHERDQIARRVDPSRQACSIERHQRGERICRARGSERMFQQ